MTALFRRKFILFCKSLLKMASSSTAKNSDHYTSKLILAPMVKIGTLSARLLALRYGADLVYTEEIIDFRMCRARRVYNEMLGITEYIDKTDGTVVFSTNLEEKSRVIFQMGTSDPDRAVQVLLKVQEDVSGIDVNMGCPKEFSIKGGMGAALLKKPDKIKAILTNLVAHAKIPVTCKIRVLSTIEDTIELALLIQSTGVSAIAVHGRNVNERPQHKNSNNFIKAVAEKLEIPVIANGGSKEINCYQDIQKFRADTGSSSVMIARASGWNPSIFRKEGGKLEIDTCIKEFLKLSVLTDNAFSNTKYTIQYILRELQETPRGRRFLDAQTIEEICEIWDLHDFYQEKKLEWDEFKSRKRSSYGDDPSESDPKKLKLDKPFDDSIIFVPDCYLARGKYYENRPQELPKSVLHRWVRGQGTELELPKYRVESSDKKFIAVVEFGGKKYMTDVWEKNKRQAEQGAALACCRHLNLIETPKS